MKIFFLTSRFPYPLDKGDKLRSYYFIRYLSKYHDIVLVSLSEEKIPSNYLKHVESIVTSQYVFYLSLFFRVLNVFLFLFTKRPLQLGYFYRFGLKKKIKKIIEKENPSIIFCQLVRVAQYLEDIKLPKIIDYQDTLSLGMLRRASISPFLNKLFFLVEYRRLKNYERIVFKKFEKHIIISESDREALDIEGKNKIEIVPNGVDFEKFTPKAFSNVEKKYTLLFTGNMSYMPNVHCALFIIREVLPLLVDKYPDITLVIAGKSPTRAICDFKSKNVIVTGWVDDIRFYYASANIFIAPLKIGTGLQNKLLEAMAMQMPCITSSLVNLALGAEPGKDLLIGDTPTQIAEHVETLLTNPLMASRLAKNAFDFVTYRYNWDVSINKLRHLIESSQY